MTDEPLELDVEPVYPDAEAETDSDEPDEPSEAEAVRMSSWAIASVVAAWLAFSRVTSVTSWAIRSRQQDRALGVMIELAESALPMLVAAAIAWWAGNEAEYEIDLSGGRLGGRGFARVGRLLAIATFVLFAASVVVLALFREELSRF